MATHEPTSSNDPTQSVDADNGFAPYEDICLDAEERDIVDDSHLYENVDVDMPTIFLPMRGKVNRDSTGTMYENECVLVSGKINPHEQKERNLVSGDMSPHELISKDFAASEVRSHELCIPKDSRGNIQGNRDSGISSTASRPMTPSHDQDEEVYEDVVDMESDVDSAEETTKSSNPDLAKTRSTQSAPSRMQGSMIQQTTTSAAKDLNAIKRKAKTLPGTGRKAHGGNSKSVSSMVAHAFHSLRGHYHRKGSKDGGKVVQRPKPSSSDVTEGEKHDRRQAVFLQQPPEPDATKAPIIQITADVEREVSRTTAGSRGASPTPPFRPKLPEPPSPSFAQSKFDDDFHSDGSSSASRLFSKAKTAQEAVYSASSEGSFLTGGGSPRNAFGKPTNPVHATGSTTCISSSSEGFHSTVSSPSLGDSSFSVLRHTKTAHHLKMQSPKPNNDGDSNNAPMPSSDTHVNRDSHSEANLEDVVGILRSSQLSTGSSGKSSNGPSDCSFCSSRSSSDR
jgi:hypothetical protein